jgi:hypothetical protein
MASAVVRSDPEPEKLARTKAAAHTVVERGMLNIIWKHWVGLSFERIIERSHG